MAIVGIIVLIAGQAFSDSTKFRIRTQNMLKATQEAENVATFFKSDISQMGAKSSLEQKGTEGADDTFSGIYSGVYMDLKADGDPDDKVEDYSSFAFDPEEPSGELNSFTFRRIRYGTTGKYEALEEVKWFRDRTNLSLKRRCRILAKVTGASDNGCAPKDVEDGKLPEYDVEMATGVYSFQVQPAIPSVLESDGIQMFPPSDGNSFRLVARYGEEGYYSLNVGGGGAAVTLSNFASNYNPATESGINSNVVVNEVYVFANTPVSGDWKYLCTSEDENHFEFSPGFEYEISFNILTPGTDVNLDDSQMFVPGVDHMAVGIRNAGADKLGQKVNAVDDFMFFPPTMEDAYSIKRTVRFSVPEKVEACVAFTFSFFSPVAAGGSITISNFKLTRVATSNYKFDKDKFFVPKADKKNVKAFKLKLKIGRGGSGKVNAETGQVEVGESGEVEMVIPTPSNGPKD